jgi:predicted PurR-regulated permease PerM
VAILGQTEAQIQRYMLAMLVSNVLIAICTWLAFEAWGLNHAGVWGIAAGVLHFIPYVGPTLIAAASTIGAFLQFGSLFEAVLVGGTSAVIAGVIGVVFMTWLHSRFARVNAAVLFISLLFWLVVGVFDCWRAARGDRQVVRSHRVFKPFENCSGVSRLL